MAQSFGFIYALFLAISNFGQTPKQILLLQTVSFFFKSIHYYLLGGLSGFLTSIISMIRNITFAKLKSNKIWTILFILVYIIIGVFTFSTLGSIFPIIATIFYTIIVSKNNPLYLRIGMLITSVLWFFYNIYIISYAGIITQIVIIIFNVIAIIKLDKKK